VNFWWFNERRNGFSGHLYCSVSACQVINKQTTKDIIEIAFSFSTENVNEQVQS
jgi:hypothetical protein